jgi:hypothetical protein
MAKKPSTGKTLVISAVVRDIEPKIWRRLLVPAATKLHRLHRLLQIAFGWQDYHLYEFRNKTGDVFGDPSALDDRTVEDASRKTVGTVLRGKGFALFYNYDFGDDWEVDLKVEDVVDEALAAACVDGARAGPLEDCGGTPGYEDLLEALADPKHERHDELKEWSGGFDPERFYVRAVNAAIRAEFK